MRSGSIEYCLAFDRLAILERVQDEGEKLRYVMSGETCWLVGIGMADSTDEGDWFTLSWE